MWHEELSYGEIITCCKEAIAEDDSCEIFFLDDHPEVEGYLISLQQDFGWNFKYFKEDNLSGWKVTFKEECK